MSELPPGVRNSPYVVDEQPGRKAWCACGHSSKQPYCDGSHARKAPGVTPVICHLDAAKKVAWCACRRSGTKPFCDGTHKTPAP